MPSIHPSFFFPLCWLPSPVHDHYFNTSHECKSSARIQLHQLYCSQLNELKELKQKAQKVLDYCDDDSDVVMKDQASTGNSNQMSVNSSTGQGLSNRNLNSTIASSIHERKQPSFNDEDFVSLQEFLSKSNDEMTWEEIQKMKQSESISVNIRSNQSGTHQSDNNGHVAQERSTAHHHHNHHHSKSHTLPSTDWVQNVKIIEKEMKWAARYQPHRIPMERGIWLKLDSLLLREREENTQLVQNQSSKSSTSSQDFENGKRGGGAQVEASPEACTGFKKNFQMALRLIESENELAVDQFDLVVQLCTKMIYSVVTQSPLCCPKWELENELNSVANISTEKKVNNNLPQYMLSRIHKTILRKSEEIYWRKFIEIIFLKLIVDPKCIVVGLSYFEKVVSLLENERVSSPLLKGAQHDGSNKDHSLRNSFNRNELKTIMCICVMLSSKMYDEDNYWKSKTYFKLFSSLCRKREDHKRITFKEFNQLEVEILNVLQFDLTLDMDAFGRRIVQRFLKVHFDEESALLMI